MNKFIFLTLLAAIQLAFALPQIENAKIGSTIMKDYSSSRITPIVGHAGVVINEYIHKDDWNFIVESAPTIFGLETTTSYNYFLNDNTYLDTTEL